MKNMPSIFGETSLLDEFVKSLKNSATTPNENNDASGIKNESEEKPHAEHKQHPSLADGDQSYKCNSSMDLERIKALENELERLKCLLKTSTCTFESQPIADITYFDNDLSRKFRVSVENFINKTFSGDETSKDDKNHDVAKSKEPVARCTYLEGYIINSWGQPLSGDSMEGWEISRHDHIEGELGGKEQGDASSSKKRTKISCFNCGGDHSISNCPKEKDQARINVNKNIFSNSTPKNNLTSKRYHAEENKFHRLKPGVLSDKLKEALGMRETDLPPYIYNMRLLGYPPGHLQLAKSSKSKMAIFGCDGEEICLTGETLEEGELLTEDAEHEYNAEMIVRYPGFNVQAPEEIVDDYMRLRRPPMQPQHTVDFMVKHLNSKAKTRGQARKRPADDEPELARSSKRLKVAEDVSLSVVDMDIEDDSEVQNASQPPLPPPPPLPPGPTDPPFCPPPLPLPLLPENPRPPSPPSESPRSPSPLSRLPDGPPGSEDQTTNCLESPSSPVHDEPSSPTRVACIPTSPPPVDERARTEDVVMKISSGSNSSIVIDEGDDSDLIICDDDYVIVIDEEEDAAEVNVDSDSKILPKTFKEEACNVESQVSLLTDSLEPKDVQTFPPPKFDLGTLLPPMIPAFQMFSSLPSLDKFSNGVIKYEILEEPIGAVGGFRKIREAISGRRRKRL